MTQVSLANFRSSLRRIRAVDLVQADSGHGRSGIIHAIDPGHRARPDVIRHTAKNGVPSTVSPPSRWRNPMARTKKRVLEDHRTTAQNQPHRKQPLAWRPASSRPPASSPLRSCRICPARNTATVTATRMAPRTKVLCRCAPRARWARTRHFVFSHGCVWCARCMVRVS